MAGLHPTEVQELLLSTQVLVHFDPNHCLCLVRHQSMELGWCCHMLWSQKTSGICVAFPESSRNGYSQIEKEGFACILEVTKSHMYVQYMVVLFSWSQIANR